MGAGLKPGLRGSRFSVGRASARHFGSSYFVVHQYAPPCHPPNPSLNTPIFTTSDSSGVAYFWGYPSRGPSGPYTPAVAACGPNIVGLKVRKANGRQLNMALKSYKPTTPGQRGLVLIDRSELWKGRPVKSLTEGLTKNGGRNNTGRITMRRKVGVPSAFTVSSISNAPSTIWRDG